MKSGTRTTLTFLMLSLLVIAMLSCTGCGKNKEKSKPVSNEEAETKKDENRYITVINKTDSSTINLVEITTDTGIFVSKVENPDDRSFSFLIGETWNDRTDFIVTLIDVYGLKFEKAVTLSIPDKKDIEITEDDYVEQPGDWWRIIDRRLNEWKSGN